ASLVVARVPPGSLLIAGLWVVGLWLIGKAQKGLPWQVQGPTPPGGQPQPQGSDQPHHGAAEKHQPHSTLRTVLVFVAAAGVTLVAGVVLARSGDALATHLGMSGLLFGATVLAAATSLPELSTGLASMKAGDYQLAVSDIFGGNAFLPVLFLVASVISGQAVLPHAGHADLYLTGLGMLLTCVYMYGLIFRSQRQVARMGLDSLVVLALYALGVLGLLTISK
ncbi:MAG: sodium:calcium antiporter, partial [Hymenobacter sp.]